MNPARHFTIGQIMIGIAVVAGVLAIPRMIYSSDRPVLLFVVAMLSLALIINATIEAITGLRCPTCSRWALRRLARHRRYYRCRACGARLRRVGMFRWLDASGPEDERRYQKSGGAGVWKGFDVPRDLKGSSSGVLLGSKRARDPIDEVKQHSPRPAPMRLESAERKVRAFLSRRREDEE